MRRLQNEMFIGIGNLPVKVSDSEREGSGHSALIGEMLDLCFRVYEENHSIFARQGKVLSMSETRLFNRLVETLGIVPQYAFIELENEAYQLVKKLALWAMPITPCWRNGPHLLDLLDSIPDVVALPVPSTEKEKVEV